MKGTLVLHLVCTYLLVPCLCDNSAQSVTIVTFTMCAAYNQHGFEALVVISMVILLKPETPSSLQMSLFCNQHDRRPSENAAGIA